MEVKDEKCRLVIILADIQGKTLILANVYPPNVDHPNFFVDLEKNLQGYWTLSHNSRRRFNIVLDKILDRSKPDSVLLVKRMCTSLGLTDVRRLNHPADRDYTFYSEAHKVYSRIYVFLISSSLLPATLSCYIDSILLTDHAMVRLDHI